MNDKRRYIKVGVLLLVLFVAGYVVVTRFPNTLNPTHIDVRGRVLDLESNIPLHGVEVRVSNSSSKVVTDDSGEFSFEHVNINDIIVVNGKSFFEDVEIPVNERSYVEIYLSSKLLSAFRDLESFEKYRSYRDLYKMISQDAISGYTEDEYLVLKNEWRDGIVDSGEYTGFDVSINRGSMRRLTGTLVTVSIDYVWEMEQGAASTTPVDVQFVLEQGRWYVGDLLIGQ